MEDLLGTWGALQSVVHGPAIDKGELGRRVATRCVNAQCKWHLPEHDPEHLRLPKPFPMRFQNLIAAGGLKATTPRCPNLFCGAVGEGGVDEGTSIPNWLYCREANCDKCGFEARFPACPTILALPSVTCRVQSSAVRYLEWVVAGRHGEEPKRKKLGEMDQLVEVKLPGKVFHGYVAERMNVW